MRTTLSLGPNELRIVFMGAPARVGGRPLSTLAADVGLEGVFEERPPGTRDEARQLLRESSMAVAFQGETRTQVPAKVFEYVAFPVWLLALVGAESATADALADSDAIVLDIDDEAGTAQAIESCYRRFRAGESARPVGWDGRFSRARQAERLVAELQVLEVFMRMIRAVSGVLLLAAKPQCEFDLPAGRHGAGIVAGKRGAALSRDAQAAPGTRAQALTPASPHA